MWYDVGLALFDALGEHVLRPLVLQIEVAAQLVALVVAEECVDPCLPQVTLAVLAVRAADGRVSQKVVVVLAEVRQTPVAPVSLQVADKLAATAAHPAPVREGLEDRFPARRLARVGVELFKVAADLSLEKKLLAMADREGILVIVI